MTASHVDKLRAIVEAWDDAVAERPCPRCNGSQIDPVRVGHDPVWCADCGGAAIDVTIGSEAVRAAMPELLAVVEAVLLDHDQSIGPEEQAEGVKQWWKLPATKAALDALDARIAALPEVP